MRLANLLATRKGRIAAFFLMYLTEGVPQGFATTAVATQMRRLGMGTAEIGGFLGFIMLPWAFKWAYGPFVDLLGSRRQGPRRSWILMAQGMMVLTLLGVSGLELPGQLALFTAALFVHNLFAAVQDVAVDALAVSTLQADERAFASGMMFGGQSLGMLIGGGGALLLGSRIGFTGSILVLAAVIGAVLVFAVLPMREPVVGSAAREGSVLAAAAREAGRFLREALRALLGSRQAFGGLLFGLMPIAAMALSLALQANLAVDLGLSNDEIGVLGGASAALTALSCIVGGWLSDRFDRRRALLVYIGVISLPGLYLMAELNRHGWAPGQAAPATLITAFWIAALAYHLVFGFIYGARAALFIDITQPAVAATQFAAYMALTNLSIAYSAVWQGYAVKHWGYAATLGLDSLVGLASLIFLPLLRTKP